MRKASTVVPICGNRILLVKRKASARFMANRFVFPGGVEEECDAHWGPQQCSSASVCALRELFEEAGILMVTSALTASKAELEDARVASTKDPREFVHFLERHRAYPAVSRLKPWSKWITPVQEKHRYDTSFFVLRVTDNQADNTKADLNEVTEHVWLTPSEALEAHDAKRIELAPPTWLTLMELKDREPSSIFSSQRKLTPIQPEIVPGEGTGDVAFAVCLPGDHQHPTGKGTAGLRRIVADSQLRYRWIDTIEGTSVAHSNF